MAQEQFFSLPNLFWFAAGAGLEVWFLAYGVTPGGMELGANIAESLGMMEGVEMADGVEAVTTSTGQAGLDFSGDFSSSAANDNFVFDSADAANDEFVFDLAS